jgi:hypothetical protein
MIIDIQQLCKFDVGDCGVLEMDVEFNVGANGV